MIKNDKIITGPAYLVVEDVPTPLAVPFGFFPNKQGQSSGLVLPTYGESQGLGFFLNKGGYYWSINDYLDLSLLGDIYTRGSWGLNVLSNYRNRYKYRGNFSAEYSVFRQSDPEFPDFSRTSTCALPEPWTRTTKMQTVPASTAQSGPVTGALVASRKHKPH